jgi:hypothetical protein
MGGFGCGTVIQTNGGFAQFASLNVYRATDSSPPWGPANGTNGFDSNAPSGPFLTVTNTSTNGSPTLVVSGASWTANQWAAYSVIDITQSNTGDIYPYLNFATIYSNTATTAYFLQPEKFNQLLFTNGEIVQFWQVINPHDQPGMGTNATITRNGSTGAPHLSLPVQAIDPIYQWSNTFEGSDAEIIPYNVYPCIVSGVHYMNDTAKPGYVPFT